MSISIIDLETAHLNDYCLCLEEWSSEIKEAGEHKSQWYARMKDLGLRVKLAADEQGRIGGMIQYIPIELSPTEGKYLYFVLCIWVHGYKEGRGNFQKKGYGAALLQAAEEDVKALGSKGLVVWGLTLPFWMRASWFKKHGYKRVDKDSIRALLWKPFTEDAIPPKWIREKKTPGKIPGKVAVTAFIDGWCPAQNLCYERARRASLELGDKVVFQTIETGKREVFLEWGIQDAIFVDGKQIRTGPPPSFEKVKKIISKRIRKHHSE